MKPIDINWIGGEHAFALGLGELEALQEASGVGPQAVYTRITAGEWKIADILQTLRLGLIGAESMDRDAAGPFVTLQIETHGWLPLVPVAQRVLGSALIGPLHDPVDNPGGDSEPGEEKAGETRPQNGNSQPSTE